MCLTAVANLTQQGIPEGKTTFSKDKVYTFACHFKHFITLGHIFSSSDFILWHTGNEFEYLSIALKVK